MMSTGEVTAELQEELAARWDEIGFEGTGERCLVVLPSMTIDIPRPLLARAAPTLLTLEQRLICMLPLLLQPGTSLVYLTSATVSPTVADYWFGMVPGLDTGEARRRLALLSADDRSPRPLAAKLLERPDLLSRVRDLIPDPERAYLLPFHANELDHQVAAPVGIPVYGVRPDLAQRFGSKSGARAVFADCGVPHPAGVSGVRSVDDVVAAIRSLQAEGRQAADMVLKRDTGGGGHANAILRTAHAGTDAELHYCVRALRPDDRHTPPELFLSLLEQTGGVVEELITGDDVRSPSAQLRISPAGEVEVLATHDQILAGATKQSYAGCRFPASSEYAGDIARQAVKVGRSLARSGMVGHAGIDFVVRRQSAWEVFAVEINPRMTGTLHHAYTLRLLTGGRYDPQAGLFRTPGGMDRFYVGLDQVAGPRGTGLDQLLDRAHSGDVAWDPVRQTGVVFQTVSGLAVSGNVGVTAIGSSPEEAEALLDRTVRLLAGLSAG
jgi:hypothetical protein